METPQTPTLELRDIYKSFGDVEVLKGISIEIKKGELLTFLGPSGCGKTTLLRIVGGFTPATSGQVLLDGEDISALLPNMRKTRMVFQSYALFPHMTVAKNIGFSLKLHKWRKEKIDTRVEELLSLVHMEGLGDRTIDRISGGQQQRVALARALALEPKVLLLDEPLSNLDANLRVMMREEIRNIQERLGVTTIFVTHDQYEAMSISDRLLVLNDGVIQQIGSPMKIYEEPANKFIAGFVGYVNFLKGTVDAIDKATKTVHVSTECGRLELDNDQDDITAGDEVLLVIRPEIIPLSLSHGKEKQNTFHGTVESLMYAGNIAKYTVIFEDREMIIDQNNPRAFEQFKQKDKVKVTVPRTIHLIKKYATSAAVGSSVISPSPG